MNMLGVCTMGEMQWREKEKGQTESGWEPGRGAPTNVCFKEVCAKLVQCWMYTGHFIGLSGTLSKCTICGCCCLVDLLPIFVA